MIRNPAVAGQFYYYDPKLLIEQIEGCIDKDAKKLRVSGVLSPHAGYMYSGKVAGSVFSRIEMTDSFVILGPNHTGLGSRFAICRDGLWRMPLGDVRIDSNLANEIFKNSKFLDDDMLAHESEHSIEVQIPFLQYFGKDFQIVPITIMHYPPDDDFLRICEDIGNAIATAIKNLGEEVTIIASSDLTHYEPQDEAKRKDKAALDAILELNPEKLFRVVRELRISMCGFAPVAIMLFACRELGAKNTRLVKYMTSGDTTKDYREVVGYGGVLIF